MRKMLSFLLFSSAALADDNSWTKVQDLKTGTELRIFKKNARQPILAMMDEANDERLVVMVKNEQLAIQKDDIDRIDYRPIRASRVTKESHTSVSDPAQKGPPMPNERPGPTTSSSTSFGVQNKPDFETIYRRTAGSPKDAPK